MGVKALILFPMFTAWILVGCGTVVFVKVNKQTAAPEKKYKELKSFDNHAIEIRTETSRFSTPPKSKSLFEKAKEGIIYVLPFPFIFAAGLLVGAILVAARVRATLARQRSPHSFSYRTGNGKSRASCC